MVMERTRQERELCLEVDELTLGRKMYEEE